MDWLVSKFDRFMVWASSPSISKESVSRRKARSDFTPGHAKAIAEQWGAYILEQQ